MGAAIGDLIRTADAGDGAAAKELFAALYQELHAVAQRQLRRGGAEMTLGTTTLLHEAYLNIVDRAGLSFPDRTRFLDEPGTPSASRGNAYLILGRALRGQGDPAQARAAFSSAVELLRPTLGPNHPKTRMAERLLRETTSR